MKHRHKAGLAALAALAAGGLLWSRGGFDRARVAVNAPPGAPTATTASTSTERPAHCGLRAGANATWHLESRVEGAFDPPRLLAQFAPGQAAGGVALTASPPQRVDARETWALDAHVLSVTPGEDALLAARLRPLETADAPPAGAEAPFLLRLGRHCDVAAFARTADAAPGVAEAQQSRVVELQFFAAAQDATQRGFDSRGVYDAAWRRRADASLEGTATRYLRPHGRDRSLATTTDAIVEHVTEVETGGGAWFSHLQRRSLVRTLVGPTLEVGRLSVRLEARAQPAADWSPTLDPNAAGWRWGWLFGRATPEADTLDAATRARLSALSLDAALAEYLKMLAPGAANPAQWTRFLRDWLRLHPDQLGALLARLRDPGLLKIPGARSGAFHALATADLPEIRDALFALMSDPNAPMDLRQEAMRALAKAGLPPPGYIDAVVKMADSGPDAYARGDALLTLGFAADQLADVDPASAAAAESALLAAMNATGDADRVRSAIVGAGNTGSVAFVEPLKQALESDEALTRALAARALGRMPSDTAAAWLAQRLGVEDDRTVRRALAEASVHSAGVRNAPVAPGAVQAVRGMLAPGAAEEDFRVALAVLDAAARGGDADARSQLLDAYAQEKRREQPDAKRLVALGAFVDTPWRRVDP